MATYAWDTETYLIAPGRLAPRLVCLSYAAATGPGQLLLRDDALAWFRARLRAGDTLVGANVAFDVGVMVQADPSLMSAVWTHYDRGLFVDVMIADQLAHIARGWYTKHPRTGKQPRFGLADMSSRYGFAADMVEGKVSPDSWRYRYRELEDVPLAEWPHEAKLYATRDAEATRHVYDTLRRAWPVDVQPQVRSAWSLHLMSAWGMRTDPDAIAALSGRLTRHIGDAKQQLRAAGILRKDGTKDMAVVRARVEEALGTAAPKTASGATSTSREVLESTGDPDLELLAKISNASKLQSTYVPALQKGVERPISARYFLKRTGRTSSRYPNIQNQPRFGGVRECWVPRPGWLYVACDYHIAELCALAQICISWFNESAMAEAINAGHDLHLVTGAQLLSEPIEQVIARKSDPDVKQARQMAKALNFGFPGGLGAANFCAWAKTAYGLTVSEEEARRLKTTWLGAYPEMKRYFRKISDSIGPKGSFDATQEYSGRVRGGCGFTDGANTYFQGLVADGARLALYEVQRRCYDTKESPLYGCRSVAFIHDEILLEAPAERAPAAAKELELVMAQQMQIVLPDVAVRATAHLMSRWYKNAEPVYNADGELIPWTP